MKQRTLRIIHCNGIMLVPPLHIATPPHRHSRTVILRTCMYSILSFLHTFIRTSLHLLNVSFFSAGVGRTGMLIGLHMVMEQIIANADEERKGESKSENNNDGLRTWDRSRVWSGVDVALSNGATERATSLQVGEGGQPQLPTTHSISRIPIVLCTFKPLALLFIHGFLSPVSLFIPSSPLRLHPIRTATHCSLACCHLLQPPKNLFQ